MLPRKRFSSRGRWGQLVATDTGDAHLTPALAAGVEALQLGLADVGGGQRRDAAAVLLLDLIQGPGGDLEEVSRRAAAVGVPADEPITALLFVLAQGRCPMRPCQRSKTRCGPRSVSV